ncbi:S41 family peptidase [Sphingobacterium chuzhouense]|uniref:Tail specific protease domain-containing protein n=1 Tax=Sphingobacterium chuzhouense TaxID=1742264 RepID=A0ABR7XP43_9SPHI|nr:S41 family peptidase [Sphingobacterium chuzhouense]MBD1420622.1 hypothetical protein [Sphingobacterium chuzhouense]
MNLQKYLLLLCLGILFACKKEIKSPPNPEPEEPTEQERLRANIYDYFNKYSLWTENIPDLDEKGRLDFVKKYSSHQGLLTALKNMTPQYFFQPYQTLNITVGNRYDRYSFLDESDTEGNVSYADGFRMDTNEGYGLYFYWGQIQENSENWARPVIYFVEGGSPGQQKGIKRGLTVQAINERENTRVSVVYRNGNYYIEDENLAQQIQNEWYDAMDKPELKLKLKDSEGLINDYTLNHASSYEIDPVILDSIYTYPDKKIGYLAYSSFEEVWPSSHRNYQKLEQIFQAFESANINDLILDLRYNPGGYVDAAEYLANKIIGSSGDKQMMFSYETNEYLAVNNNVPRGLNFEQLNFNRKNNLNLDKVFVLVTEQTASASELLISVLKPYMNVILIGDEPRTYGKPVGFFEQKIPDSEVSLWAASFKTMNNAQTEEDRKFQNYWDGLPIATTEIVPDRIFYDFGDTNEDMIAKALALAGIPSSMRASTRKSGSAPSRVKLGIINKPRERNMLKIKD